MSRSKKFSIITFGCRLNQYQSEKIREHLLSFGWEFTRPEGADVIIINGCVVTHRGERDVRKAINRYKRLNKELIITGCYANLPYTPSLHPFAKFYKFQEFFQVFPSDRELILPQSKARVLIGIQEGCNFRCSYCIVPFVRGRSRYREREEILQEIENYVSTGVREIVITGTEIGSFPKLWEFLREIKQRYPELKIRLSSILPNRVNKELVSLIEEEVLLPHIHLPMQSASPKVLKDMKRPYTIERFIRAFEELYKANEKIAIGTDIIVGFPTETEQDFEKTVKVFEALPFAYAHIFLFSKRPFTQAYHLKELPYQMIKNREKVLLEIAKKKKLNFLKKFLGKSLLGIIEKVDQKIVEGTTENYIKFKTISKFKLLPGMEIEFIGEEIDLETYKLSGRIENVRSIT